MFTNKWMDATGGTGGNGTQNTPPADEGQQQQPTFETWLEKQDDTVRTLLDGHVKGLKSALESERVSRKDLERQLRDLAKKAEAGSESQTKLTEMADQMAATERRADFYDEAHKAGVSNLKLAYLAATNEGLFDKQGRVNFAEMKKDYPELFASSNGAHGDAGSGTGPVTGQAGLNMNEKIRKASGRQ